MASPALGKAVFITWDPTLAVLVPFLERHLTVRVAGSIGHALVETRGADVAVLDWPSSSAHGLLLAQAIRRSAPGCVVVALQDGETRLPRHGGGALRLARSIQVEELLRRLDGWLVGRGRPALEMPHAHLTRTVQALLGGGLRTGRVTTLSRLVGVSRAHLSLLFRRQLGYSLKVFLLRVRVAVAMQLLVLTDHKLDAIAWQVGFADGPHLSRVFYRLVGCWPGQYRRAAALSGLPSSPPWVVPPKSAASAPAARPRGDAFAVTPPVRASFRCAR